MRAYEFIVEDQSGLDLKVSKDDDGVAIKATAGGKQLGYAEFFFDDEGKLDPQAVWVDERFRGQGIGAAMYDYLKRLGYTIIRSWDQTPAGKGMWDKHRGADVNVWEDRGQGAAGIVLYAQDTGRYGLQQRSDNINDPGLWAAWGGGREPGETLEQCARRELAEESGYRGSIKLKRLAENPQYVTFIGVVPHEFEPTPSDEWKDYCWVEAGDWPSPMHPKVAAALKNIAVSENFADGKNPGRKGLSRRVGIPKKASLSQLQKIASSSTGERRRMAQWQLNMRRGKAKKNK